MQLLALIFGMQVVAGEDTQVLQLLEQMGLAFLFIIFVMLMLVFMESPSRGRKRGL